MPRFLSMLLVVAAASALCHADTPAPTTQPPLPKPSLYPLSWELKFTWEKPSRVVVEVPGHSAPQAYWYLPYTLTNTTGQERLFLPVFELVGPDGKVIRSDKNTPRRVVDTIKVREGNKFIQSTLDASGEIRLGPEQAKYGVAVWPEPALEMGHFSILVAGLSGETQTLTSPAGEPTLLRKTLQLNFVVNGDEVYPGEDKVNANPEQWIMR